MERIVLENPGFFSEDPILLRPLPILLNNSTDTLVKYDTLIYSWILSDENYVAVFLVGKEFYYQTILTIPKGKTEFVVKKISTPNDLCLLEKIEWVMKRDFPL